MSWRKRVFFTAVAAELAFFVYLFANGGNGDAVVLTAVLLWVAFLATVVGAVLSLRKPRYWPAVVWMLVHAVPLLSFFAEQWRRPYRYAHETEEERRREAAEQRSAAAERQLQARNAELNALVVAHKLQEAKAYMRAHPELRFGFGTPFSSVLCPADKRAPDLDLVRMMGERGAPRGGDLLVEAAQCSLTAVRAVMSLGIAANAVSGEGRSALTKARDLDLLAFLVGQGVPVNARDEWGRTPLMYHRSAEVTRFLLAHGADPRAQDGRNNTALHYDGPRDQLFEIYRALLDAGADPNVADSISWSTPLRCLASPGRFDAKIAELLIRHGANWRDFYVLEDLVGQGYFPPSALKLPGFDVQGADGAKYLVLAIKTQRFEFARKLLDLGANPSFVDPDTATTPLAYLAAEWSTEHPLYPPMLAAAARFTAKSRATSDSGASPE